MIRGTGQLLELERGLERLQQVPQRAAVLALPLLLKVAEGEWAAGEGAGGDPFEPLKHGGGPPIVALTRQNTGHVTGRAVIITTPDEEKYHQGGYFVHAQGQQALRDAKKEAAEAKAGANAEGLKRARKKIRETNKLIRTTGTRVAKRPPLPVSRKALPVTWGRALALAFDRAMAEAIGKVAA